MSVSRIAMGYRYIGSRRVLRYLIEYAPGPRSPCCVTRIILKNDRRNRNRIARVALKERRIGSPGLHN